MFYKKIIAPTDAYPSVRAVDISSVWLFLGAKFGGEATHLFGYGFVDDFGVDLSRANVGMSEHSGDNFH